MKDDVLQFRISTDDKNKIKEMAKESGLSLTDFIISKCNDKCNDNDYIISRLTSDLKESDSQLQYFKESLSELTVKNKELLKRVEETPVIEVDAFEKCSVNSRPKIHVFVDWVGYSMFIRNADNLEKDKEKRQLYHEVWDNHIKPMYKEFCEKFK